MGNELYTCAEQVQCYECLEDIEPGDDITYNGYDEPLHPQCNTADDQPYPDDSHDAEK